MLASAILFHQRQQEDVGKDLLTENGCRDVMESKDSEAEVQVLQENPAKLIWS